MVEVQFEGKMNRQVPVWVLQTVSDLHPLGHQTAAYEALRKLGYSNQALGKLSPQNIRVVECVKIGNLGQQPKLKIINLSPTGETESNECGAKWYVKVLVQFTLKGTYYHSEHELGMWVSDTFSQVTEHILRVYTNEGTQIYEA